MQFQNKIYELRQKVVNNCSSLPANANVRNANNTCTFVQQHGIYPLYILKTTKGCSFEAQVESGVSGTPSLCSTSRSLDSSEKVSTSTFSSSHTTRATSSKSAVSSLCVPSLASCVWISASFFVACCTSWGVAIGGEDFLGDQ